MSDFRNTLNMRLTFLGKQYSSPCNFEKAQVLLG